MALADSLLGPPSSRPRRTILGPAVALELQFQVFAVAARRVLARNPGPQAVAGYVEAAYARLRIGRHPRSIQKGVRLVNAALGRIDWKDGAFARDMDLVACLLSDLLRVHRTSPAEVGMLIAAGEQRVQRLRRARQARRQSLWNRLRTDRLQLAPASVLGGELGAVPRTIVGRGLKALARFDIEAARALPDDPSPDSVRAVTDLAFSIAVHERFGERPDPEHIALLAEGVSKHSRTPPIEVSDVESMVLAEFVRVTGDEPDNAIEIKVAAFVRIVDDLGLYSHEIDELIETAEQIAEEDGCQLSFMQ